MLDPQGRRVEAYPFQIPGVLWIENGQEVNNIGTRKQLLTPVDGTNDPVVFGSANFGIYNPRKTATTPMVRASAKDESNPQIVTVAFALDPLSQTLPNFSRDVKAKVVFGVGGANLTAFVDLVNGAQITVPATALQVSFLYRVYGGPASGTDFGLLTGSVALSHGSRPAASKPTFTDYGGTVAGLGNLQTRVYTIPPFAKSFQVFSQAGNALNISYDDGSGVFRYVLALAAGVLSPVFPIFGNATPNGDPTSSNSATIQVQNQGAGADVPVVVYDLNL